MRKERLLLAWKPKRREKHFLRLKFCAKPDYSRLQTMREQSDYNCTYNATEEEITPLIPLTGEFIETILVMIKA